MAAVTEDGELFTWGYGSNGRLGHGDEKDQHKPVRVQWFTDNSILIRRVRCGGHHTIAVAGTLGTRKPDSIRACQLAHSHVVAYIR